MKTSPQKIFKVITGAVIILVIVIIVLLFVVQKSEYVEGYGVVTPNKVKNVYSPVQGRVNYVYREFGDILQKGDKVIELDTDFFEKEIKANSLTIDDVRMGLESKKNDLVSIKIQKKEAKRNLEILKLDKSNLDYEYSNLMFLIKTGERSNLELKKLENLIKQKELEIKNLEGNNDFEKREVFLNYEIENLNKRLIYFLDMEKNILKEMEGSTIIVEEDDYTLISKDIKDLEGSFAQKGTLLFSMADISKLKMLISVEEAKLGKIKIGQKTKIFLDSIPYEKFTTLEGEVIKIFPQAKGESTYDKVELEITGFTNKLKTQRLEQINLKSGLKGRARIVVKKRRMLIFYLLDKILD